MVSASHYQQIKAQVMEFEYFVGVDISKKTLDISVVKEGKKLLYRRVANDREAIGKAISELGGIESFSMEKVLFCMEHTSVYSSFLLELLDGHGAKVWLVHGAHIKHSSGLTRGKSDKVDSYRIASFAFKNRYEAKLWKPQRQVVVRLKHLIALRERCVGSKNALSVPIEENGPFIDKSIAQQVRKLSQASIKALKETIKKVEGEIRSLIKSDPLLDRLFNIVTSVPGVGPVTASKVIALTNEFLDISEPKKFACYAGVAPFEHSSGTSLKGKSRVSHKAHKPTKHALHMAAVTTIRYDNEFGKYYKRKVAEGKPKMAAINAIRNKIILRIFACVRDGRKYEISYTT